MKIKIEFDNNVSEFIHADRLYYSHGVMSKVDKVVAILLLLSGVYMLKSDAKWLAAMFFVLAPLEWFNLFSLRPLQTRLRFSLEPKFSERYYIEFDDSGIDFRTETIESHLDWSFYNSFMESDRIFLLVYGKMMHSIVPKRAFANHEEISAFRELIRRNISAK